MSSDPAAAAASPAEVPKADPKPVAVASAESAKAVEDDSKEFEYPTSADKYELKEEIGKGAFATVYSAQVLGAGPSHQVAVKIIDLEPLTIHWDEIRKEILVMKQMMQENVIQVLCAFNDEEELWIVMPLLEGGSCASIIKRAHPHGIKNVEVVATILRDTLVAMQYIHAKGTIHRDIKAGNILLALDGTVKLADFGVSGALREQGTLQRNRRTFVGTPCWMAPEVMEQQQGYNVKADIWSFGITALELAYGRAPYANDPPMKVLIKTLQEEPPSFRCYSGDVGFDFQFPKEFHKVIEKALRKDTSKRYTAEKLLKMKFFTKYAKDTQCIKSFLATLPPMPRQALQDRNKREERRKQRKPVSAPQWSFDPESMDVRKLKADAQNLPAADSDEDDAAAASQGTAVGQGAAKPASVTSATAPAEAKQPTAANTTTPANTNTNTSTGVSAAATSVAAPTSSTEATKAANVLSPGKKSRFLMDDDDGNPKDVPRTVVSEAPNASKAPMDPQAHDHAPRAVARTENSGRLVVEDS